MREIIIMEDGHEVHRGPERRIDEVVKQGFTVRYELLGIIAMIIIQTLGAVWWSAGISKDMAYIKNQVFNSYQSNDAAKDFASRDAVIMVMNKRLESLELKADDRVQRLIRLENLAESLRKQ